MRYHIRGPGRHGEAVIGTGSSITCSVAAPEEDDTFEMEINGYIWNSDSLEGAWSEAGFSKSVYNYENGTIETRIEGFVESFTKEHDMTIIKCHSYKYEGEVDMTIKIQGMNNEHVLWSVICRFIQHFILRKSKFFLNIYFCSKLKNYDYNIINLAIVVISRIIL